MPSLTVRCYRALAILMALQFYSLPPALTSQEKSPEGPAKDSTAQSVPSKCALTMLTSSEGVDFGNYLGTLFKTVRSHWYDVMPERANLGDKGIVVVQFRIQKDGKLVDESPEVIFSSRKKALDEASLKAIRKSAPFAPLPEAFTKPYIELRFSFFYNTSPPPR
jgi:TonB family protein